MRDFDVPAPYYQGLRRSIAAAAATMLCGMQCSGVAAAVYAEPDNGHTANQTNVLADCEQTDSAPRVVRACTLLLNGQKLVPSERVRILILRGVGWTKEEEFTAAAEDFSAAVEIEPANIAALTGRARAYAKLGEHAKAVEDWSSLIAIQPANDEYYRSRGTSQLAAGQHDGALADFDKSLEINSGGIDAFIGRAAVYDSLGDQVMARKEFERAIAAEPGYLAIYWERAVMAERWGEKKLAIQDYETVLKINGVYSHARKALRRLGIEHPP